VPYDQIPPQLAQAFLAAEDHNFFQHGGVDVGGFSRAMAQERRQRRRGRRLEGGSTITQQVAKNVLLTSDATVGRKLKEAILARRLEQTLDKEQILELYLNEIWLGYRSTAWARRPTTISASRSDLTLAECAYLAALPKGPGQLSSDPQQGARPWPAATGSSARWPIWAGSAAPTPPRPWPRT
jgi:penicillin-binding protein 1A